MDHTLKQEKPTTKDTKGTKKTGTRLGFSAVFGVLGALGGSPFSGF
jgi:hypothetical protein